MLCTCSDEAGFPSIHSRMSASTDSLVFIAGATGSVGSSSSSAASVWKRTRLLAWKPSKRSDETGSGDVMGGPGGAGASKGKGAVKSSPGEEERGAGMESRGS